MLDHMELVEKLREKANISFEEAKEVLEKNDWEILDAMIELEKQGKVNSATGSTDDASKQEYKPVEPTVTRTNSDKADNTNSEKKGIWADIKDTLKFIWGKLIDNKFIVKRKGEIIVKVPILVPIILLLIGLWRTLIVLLLGMIFKFRYSFEGEDLGKESVNRAMDRANDFADSIIKDDNNTSTKEESTYSYTPNDEK